MITDERRLRRYCTNFKEIENYEEAVKSPERYDLHHRREIETLEDGTTVLRSAKELKDLDLYWHRPAEELIFLKHSEHSSIPKHSEESKAKISASHSGDKNHFYGKKLSEETRTKMSAAHIGKKLSIETRAKISGDKNHNWKGDLASDTAKRARLRLKKQRELLSKQ